MLKVNNKKTIKNLAKNNFKSSKKRNIAAILAIILTTVLFTSLITIGTGAMDSLTLSMQMLKGSKADGDIRNMSKEQFEKLSEDERLEIVGCRMPVGYLENTISHNVEVNYMDSVQQELTFTTPKEGKAPEKANEIATTKKALESLGVEPRIGEKVNIEFSIRKENYKFEMVVSGILEGNSSEISILLLSEKFVEENSNIFQYTYDNDKEIAGTYFADIVFENKSNMEDQLKDIVKDLGGNSEDFNAQNFLGNSINTMTNPKTSLSTIIPVFIFAILFIFAGYLLIYNIFEISVLQEVQRYGLLKTIGMTQNQIKSLVRRQTLWLVIIGLPIGLLMGFFIGKAALPIVMKFMAAEYSNLILDIKLNPLIFIGASLFTVFTVYISTRKPIRIAARTSPLEALKYSEGTGINNNKKHSRRITIFNLARENLKRNKRRSIFIIISITLCTIILNSVIIAAQSVDVEKYVSMQSAADFTVGSATSFNKMKGYTKNKDGLDENIVQILENKFNVVDGGRIYKNTLDDKNITFDYGLEVDKNDIIEYKKESESVRYISMNNRNINLGDDNYPICNVYGVNKNTFNRVRIFECAKGIKEENIFEKLETGNFVVEAAINNIQDKNKMSKDDFQTKLGENIISRKDGKEKKEYEVIAHVYLSITEYENNASVNSGMSRVGGDGAMLYFSNDAYKKIYDNPTIMTYTFDVEDNELETVDKGMEKIVGESGGKIGYSSTLKLKDSAEGMQSGILVVGVIIGSILAIAALINFTNLMITNILTRKREYAVMESVGMTRGQLVKLTIYEGLQYSLSAGFIGIGLSAVLGTTVLKNLLGSSNFWFLTYRLTMIPAIVITIITIILSILIPIIILKVFNKETIVEKLRAL